MNDQERDAHATGELDKVRAEVRASTRRDAYFWLVMVMTAMLSAGASILASRADRRASEMKLCAIVITSDDTYRDTPPSTPLGVQQAINFSQLRRSLGCPPPEGAAK